jgi:urease accessory protein
MRSSRVTLSSTLRISLGSLLALSTLLAPATAHAHLVQTGFGEFYDGIGHLLMTLPDLFVVLATAILAGSSGAPSARRALVALPLAWLAAALVGCFAAVDVVSPWATTILFGVFGAMVAVDAKASPSLVLGASMVAGAIHGWSNGAGIGDALSAGEAGTTSGILALSGIAAGVFVIVTLVSALVVPLRSYTARIVVRVAGSWLAAIAILMAGWLARTRGAA